MKRRIRLQGMTITLSALVVICFWRYLCAVRPNYFVDIFLNATGLAAFFAGFLLRIAARGHKEEKTYSGTVLVTDGPYTFVRNPMYLGTFLIGSGIVLLLFHWWVFLLFVTAYLVIYIPQINAEERLLKSRFGTSYHQYCARVPQFIPTLSLSMLLPLLSWRWVKKELRSFLIAYLFVMGMMFVRLGFAGFVKQLVLFLAFPLFGIYCVWRKEN